MKRWFVAAFSVLLFLFACSPEAEKEDAIINEASLTEYEKSLTELMGSPYFIYDLDIQNKDIDSLRLMIDYYENGEFVQTVSEFNTSLSELEIEERVRALFMKRMINDSMEWVTSIFTVNGNGAMRNEVEGTEELSSSAWGSVSLPITLDKGEKKIVASLIYSDQTEIAVYNTINTKEDLKKATNFEQVYIFSMKLE